MEISTAALVCRGARLTGEVRVGRGRHRVDRLVDMVRLRRPRPLFEGESTTPLHTTHHCDGCPDQSQSRDVTVEEADQDEEGTR
jgi:hypothetical protein